MNRSLAIVGTVLAAHLAATSLWGNEPQITTVAGTGKPEINTHAGPALEVNIGDPFGVEIGPDEALYVTEVRNHRIWRVDRKTGQAEVVVGCGEKGYSGDGGPAREARLNEPYEVRFDADGNMYFVEMQNHLVRRVDARTGVISTVAGTGVAGFSGDGGPARNAQFRDPHSIALDGEGGLYVADIGNHRIRRIDLKTGTIDTIAGNQERRLPQDGQPARGAAVLGPRALYVHEGALWVALREGHSVWRLGLDDGVWRRIAGRGQRGYDGDGGPALNATFDGPKGIVLDAQGHIYVVDTENQAIRKIDAQTGVITTLAGTGKQGFGGDGGPARQAQLARPHGIGLDSQGRIYIGDTLNHRVREIQP